MQKHHDDDDHDDHDRWGRLNVSRKCCASAPTPAETLCPTSSARLSLWLKRAVTANRAEDVVAPAPAP
jgi:hypothetical protein